MDCRVKPGNDEETRQALAQRDKAVRALQHGAIGGGEGGGGEEGEDGEEDGRSRHIGTIVRFEKTWVNKDDLSSFGFSPNPFSC